MPSAGPLVLPSLQVGDLRLDPAPEPGRWIITAGDAEAGRIEVTPLIGRDATVDVHWVMHQAFRSGTTAGTAVTAATGWLLGEGGFRRAEAHVTASDRTRMRAASLAGYRKEGVVRAHHGHYDAVLLARVAGDPEPGSREAFAAWLNSSLPTKRTIAQALIRDDDGRVLLCQLVYKPFWDLPGGVVDPFESPADAIRREVAEELNVTARIAGLAAVSWQPPWRGWDDAVFYIFDVRVDNWHPLALQPREIAAVHWCDEAQLEQHAADYTVRVIRESLRAIDDGLGPAYLEDARVPEGQ